MRLIDADALRERFQKMSRVRRLEHNDEMAVAFEMAALEINSLGMVDAEPVNHGQWIDVYEGFIFQCSNCKASVNSTLFKSNLNYCYNCGAKMDLKEGSE